MEEHRHVIVTDIRMPFLSMMVFMIKWAFAAIPAFLIISTLFALISMILSGFMSGFIGSMHHMGWGI